MGLVLDTSALIHVEKNQNAFVQVEILTEDLVIPTIVWAELLIGLYMANSTEKRQSRRAFLAKVLQLGSLLPMSESACNHYARIYCELRKKGLAIPQNDLQVASIALATGYGVLLGPQDEMHYRKVDNLRIEVLSNL